MTDAPVASRRAVAWPLLVGVAALAGCTAAGIGALSLAAALTATGLPDPGPVTTVGLPFVRAAGEVAAVVAVGSFLFAAFLVPPQDNGVLDVDGYRALRVGTVAAGAWAVCAALLVPLTISDVSGQPITAHLNPARLWSLASLINISTAWRWTALLAAAVTLASLPVLRWSWTPLLLVGSLATLIPLGLTGHSSAGGSHDLATNSLLIHLVAASLWAGGLLALLTHVIRGGQHADLAARRFSVIALWCFGAMALSGVVNALVRILPSDLLTTDYGRLVVAKFVALCLLGVAGWRQRRTGVVALQADPSSRSRPDPAGADRGGAVRPHVRHRRRPWSHTSAATADRRPLDSRRENRLRLRRAAHPGPGALRLAFRPDLRHGGHRVRRAVPGRSASAAAARRRMADRAGPWPGCCGCRTLLFVTSSGVGRYMPAMFSMHMVAHMLLSMLVPILLVLGGPVGLALRALPAAGRGDPPGMREWLLAALHSRMSRFLTNPVVATVLFVAGFYGLYLGGLFDAAVGSHIGHVVMNVHFLVSGYLFYWVVIGVDPTPRPIPPLAKVAVVFASLPLHAFFGVVLMSMQKVLGESFYRSLHLSWHTDLLGDQRLGGGIAWAAGEIPLVVVMIALLVQWSRSDQRTATRLDRAADRDEDADLAAYNAMLAELARRDTSGQRRR